ncbi:hypothetical protein [uncultured Pelagimonas sp.]|nr:hypothetical protein [uncultured Pelagimonas sp.]
MKQFFKTLIGYKPGIFRRMGFVFLSVFGTMLGLLGLSLVIQILFHKLG